jgi:peptidoglycan/xylan/chitin deacetylase (PgdA/CDA1 family)
MTSAIKRAIERSLVASGITSLSRAILRPNRLVLAYHNIVPQGQLPFGDRSLHMPQETFAAQLDILQDCCAVVPLRTLLTEESDSLPRISITFDDAYRGALTAGLDELRRRSLPATFLVAPGMLGGRAFWWDVLADPMTGVLPAGLRERGLRELQGRNDWILRCAKEEGARMRQPPAHALSAGEELLERAAARRDVVWASHGWSHANLTQISQAECSQELWRARDWLATRFVSFESWVAYPYGLRSSDVEAAAATAGYEAGFAISGGWIANTNGNPHCLSRLNVPAGLSPDGLRLRLAGLFHR